MKEWETSEAGLESAESSSSVEYLLARFDEERKVRRSNGRTNYGAVLKAPIPVHQSPFPPILINPSFSRSTFLHCTASLLRSSHAPSRSVSLLVPPVYTDLLEPSSH